MTTRFRKQDIPKGRPTGYEGEAPENFTIPSCGIIDIDRSMFDLFRRDLKLSVGSHENGIAKVPIIFSSGEKWAMIKNNRTIRDRHGSLILPLITIMRTKVTQNAKNDIAGRGINQQTGNIVIKRRLDSSDRDYQKLINRLLIPNQLNLAVDPSDTVTGQISTDREIGDMSRDSVVQKGALLRNNRMKNVWEIITVPSPQFVSMSYEVTIWTQYMKHMNQIIDQFFSSLIVPGNHFVLNTKKGYWFVATLAGDDLTFDTNFDDQRGNERLIKTKLTLDVPGYIFATDSPGAPVPVRRYVSMPSVEFSIDLPSENSTSSTETVGEDELFIGDDDPTLPIDPRKTKREDQRGVMYPDPALVNDSHTRIEYVDQETGKNVVKYVRPRHVSAATGETVYNNEYFIDDLSFVLVDGD